MTYRMMPPDHSLYTEREGTYQKKERGRQKMDRQTDRRQTEDRQLCLGQTGREKTDRAVRLVADKQRNGEKTDRAAVLADRQKDV